MSGQEIVTPLLGRHSRGQSREATAYEIQYRYSARLLLTKPLLRAGFRGASEALGSKEHDVHPRPFTTKAERNRASTIVCGFLSAFMPSCLRGENRISVLRKKQGTPGTRLVKQTCVET